MQTRTRSFFLVVLATLSPFVVFGHPGHGTFEGHTFWHYLTSPLHLVSAIVVIGVAVIGVRYLIKKRRQIS
jgi:hypothetical protein